MIESYIYSLLLLAPTVVGMKTLTAFGHVGENVTFICSGWNTYFDTTSHVKYLCHSPCTEGKHVIIKAGPGETKHNDRVHIHNKGKRLFVTITDLQMLDSQKMICGLQRWVSDVFIEVTLKVTDGPKTTTERVTVGSSVTVTAMSSSITLLRSSYNVINMSYPTLHTTTPTASTTTGAERVPHMVIGSIVLIAITMVLLNFMRKIKKKQLMSNAYLPEEDTQGDGEYEESRTEHHQVARPPVAASTIYSSADTDPESLYANCMYHQRPELAAACDQYSKVVCLNSASKSWDRPRGSCVESQIIAPQDDFVYSFAQQPKQQIDPTKI